MSLLYNYLRSQLKYGCQLYKPLDIIINKANGIYLYDIYKKKYIDFLAGYSAVNLGHSNPRLINTAIKQLNQLHLTSRAFHNDKLIDFQEVMCKLFNYDKCLPMNTGVEAVETAIKIARKWSYEKKNINPNESVIVFASNNFHGRTISVISGSSDYATKHNFGPLLNGIVQVPYNNIKALENLFKNNPNIAAFILEPIQGEAGVILPDHKYLKKVRKLCSEYNVMMICDEIQTGLGRTGAILACNFENVKPDLVLLGKSLGGGIVPISCVLGHNEFMDVLTYGTHGFTFSGNALACSIAMESINILIDDKLCTNSYKQGKYFIDTIKSLNLPIIQDIRGKGLMNAIQLSSSVNVKNVVKKLASNGLLCKETHNNTIRLSPPLIINDSQMNKSIDIIYKSLQ